MRVFLIAAALLATVTACDSKSSIAEEKAAIANLVQSSYGGAQMSVEPIVVRTKYAIADWSNDGGGGRALVSKEHGDWKIVVAAGGDMRDPEFLVRAGVPQAEAKALVNFLLTSERKLPETRLAMLDSYKQIPR